MAREVGRGIGMGNTCKPMAVSFQCMIKFTTNKKKSNRFPLKIKFHPNKNSSLVNISQIICDFCEDQI